MNNIKKYRGYVGMSQKNLAEKVGVSRTGLNLWESGKTWIINKKKLLKMCEVLNVTPTKLLGYENFKYLPDNVQDIDYMIAILNELKEKI